MTLVLTVRFHPVQRPGSRVCPAAVWLHVWSLGRAWPHAAQPPDTVGQVSSGPALQDTERPPSAWQALGTGASTWKKLLVAGKTDCQRMSKSDARSER